MVNPYNAHLFAEVVELVDTSVSKTDALWACRFDSGLRYHKKNRDLANLAESLFYFYRYIPQSLTNDNNYGRLIYVSNHNNRSKDHE